MTELGWLPCLQPLSAHPRLSARPFRYWAQNCGSRAMQMIQAWMRTTARKGSVRGRVASSWVEAALGAGWALRKGEKGRRREEEARACQYSSIRFRVAALRTPCCLKGSHASMVPKITCSAQMHSGEVPSMGSPRTDLIATEPPGRPSRSDGKGTSAAYTHSRTSHRRCWLLGLCGENESRRRGALAEYGGMSIHVSASEWRRAARSIGRNTWPGMPTHLREAIAPAPGAWSAWLP